MKTLSLAIDTSELNEIRRLQSSIIRRAYKLACQGFDFNTIRDKIPNMKLDGHLYRCGIQRGIDLASTGHKRIVFGGKKQFIRRCNGLISKDEWKQLREQPLYSIGQANVKGNRKFQLDYKRHKLIFIINRNSKMEFDIPVLKSNWEIILEEISRKSNNKLIPLCFSLSRNKVDITFDEQVLECLQKKYTKFQQLNRYLGIDLNPNRIGVSIYKPSEIPNHDGTVIFSQQFELTSQNQHKRQYEISRICDEIYKIMKHYCVSRVGMEDLSVKVTDHKKGKRFNRQVNFWIRNFIRGKIRMICSLTDTKFCLINSTYSSFIGTLRNPELGDCCGAAAEIARRCTYSKARFYPRLISKSALVHRWKEMANVEYQDWKELYREFKNLRLIWRTPPDNSRSYRLGSWSKRLVIYPHNDQQVISTH